MEEESPLPETWNGIFCGSLKATQTIPSSGFTDFWDFSPWVKLSGFTLQPWRLQAYSFHSVFWKITPKVFKVLRALLYLAYSKEWKCCAGKFVIIRRCSPANICNRGCISSFILILSFFPPFIPSPQSPYYSQMRSSCLSLFYHINLYQSIYTELSVPCIPFEHFFLNLCLEDSFLTETFFLFWLIRDIVIKLLSQTWQVELNGLFWVFSEEVAFISKSCKIRFLNCRAIFTHWNN